MFFLHNISKMPKATKLNPGINLAKDYERENIIWVVDSCNLKRHQKFEQILFYYRVI